TPTNLSNCAPRAYTRCGDETNVLQDTPHQRETEMKNQIHILCGLVLLGLQPALLAQIPTLTSVAADSPGFAPGELVRLAGTNFADKTAVYVGGLPAAVFPNYASSTFLLVQLPVELTPGPTTLIVTTNAGSSVPFNL